MTACARERQRHQQRQDGASLTRRLHYLQVNYYAPAKLSVSDIYAPGGYPDADAAALSAHEGALDPSDASSQRGDACPPPSWPRAVCEIKVMASELVALCSMVPSSSFNSIAWGTGWMVVHEATGRIEDDTSRIHRYDNS